MSRRNFTEINEELNDKIIAAAYGSASLKTRLDILRLIRKDAAVRDLYYEYRRTAGFVKDLKKIECPDYISDRAEKKAGIKLKKEKSMLLDFYTVMFSRPAVSFALTVILIISVALSALLFERQAAINQKYSEQQVAMADRQVKETLAMVGGILNRSQDKVVKEILPAQVSKPINDGLNVINDIFKEKKDENIN